jgi:outer membrane protein assembly factor BamB
MWRYDANRSAASPEVLPTQLHLQWVRQLPPCEMAWPNESRLHFDASYEPIVMGNMLFLGVAADGSVRALDTETGEETWRFYTEGPVRFAPAAWQGRLYVGSDDGFLYCLAGDSGKLLWKVRGAPEDRLDYRHLGNNRLISFWPVRGGPVVADGTVYFGAGIWPTLGVFVVAVDARTGKTLWVNDNSNYLSQVRIDHNVLHEAGLSPQGYLLINGDKLLVPNGRSFPARLERETGELLYYVQGYRNGDCRVSTIGKFAFVGSHGVMRVEDGREAGCRWVEAGENAPNAFDGSKFHLFEGPMLPYKMFPACNWQSVLTPEAVYGMDKGKFYAYDLTNPQVSEYDKEHGGRRLKPWRWDLPLLWSAETRQAKGNPPSGVVIKASGRLYGHAGRTLVALELPSGGSEPRIAWQQQISGTPSSMLAAAGRLFVVTEEGAIHCFGPEEREATTHAIEKAPLSNRDDRWAQTARDILERSRATEGYCLVLGLDEGRLVEELVRQSKLRVIAVDADPGKVNALRDKMIAAGLCPARVDVFTGEPFGFLFPPYLANLIVSENPSAAGFQPEAHAAKLYEVLRPYGGVICLDLAENTRSVFAQTIESAKLPDRELEYADGLALLRREGALPGSASWTHETADSGRSYCSQDQLVKAPLGVLWYGDGVNHGFYKNKDYGVGVKPQVVGGRLFAYQIFSRTLHAMDVYTGRLLWKAKVEHFTRYASMEDGIYVAGGDKCVVLDPASGEAKNTFSYRMTEGTTPQVSDVRVGGDVIVIAAGYEKVRSIEKGLWDSKLLVALDRRSGQQLWTRRAEERFNNNAVAVAQGMVFCIDSVSPTESAAEQRRGSGSQTELATILALDGRTGREKWRATTTNPFREYATGGGWLGIRTNDDWLAFADQAGLLLTGRHNEVHALDARTGNELWHKRIGGGQPVIVMADRFINQAGHTYALRTGELVSGKSLFVRGGCNYAVANEHLLFVRDRCASYVELDTREKHYLRNLRSGCSNSLVAADGLLNAPCFSVKCVCNYPIQTSFAMVHMPEVDGWAGSEPQDLGRLRAASQ